MIYPFQRDIYLKQFLVSDVAIVVSDNALGLEIRKEKVNVFIVTDITFTEQSLGAQLHYIEMKPKAAAIFAFRLVLSSGIVLKQG